MITMKIKQKIILLQGKDKYYFLTNQWKDQIKMNPIITVD